jgi:hypothetical protein
MTTLKKFSFLMGSLLLFGSASATRSKKHKTSQHIVLQSAHQEVVPFSYFEKSKNFAQDYLTLGFAKKCALTVGIPMLLYQNSYTHIAVYPYLWNQSGPRAAIETLAVNGIIELTCAAISQPESFRDATDTYNYKAVQCAAILAADFLLRQTVTNPIFTRLFRSK